MVEFYSGALHGAANARTLQLSLGHIQLKNGGYSLNPLTREEDIEISPLRTFHYYEPLQLSMMSADAELVRAL
jgi:hypothetical protein